MKRKWTVRPPLFLHNFVGADCPIMPPANALQGGEGAPKPLPKAKISCSDVEHGIRGIGRQLALCDPVENNLPRGRLGSLNRVLFRIPVKQDIQFRNLGNPAAVNFPAELDGELHESSLPPQESDKCFQRDQIQSPSAPGSDRSWAGSFLDEDIWPATVEGWQFPSGAYSGQSSQIRELATTRPSEPFSC